MQEVKRMKSNHKFITMQKDSILNINNMKLDSHYIQINIMDMQKYISQTL